MNELKNKILSKKAVVGIIGLGYVGLPLAIQCTLSKFKTIGFDIDDTKVQCLKNSQSYISHIANTNVKKIIDLGFYPTSDFKEILNVDVVIICVPTPLKNGVPDLSYILSTLDNIKPFLNRNKLLILESTTYPGTTEEKIVPFIEKQIFSEEINDIKPVLGKNFYIGYSPEREDPGNINFSTKTIPKIVSGHTKKCLNITKVFYDNIVDKTIPVSSMRVAEMAKITENIHRAVNIALVNELKMITDKMNIDIYEVIDAAATKPFGFSPFYPGPGLGGHCIPIDPIYFNWKAKSIGLNTRFIDLASEINQSMPEYVIGQLKDALVKRNIKLRNSKVLVLGLSYKKNIDDCRESPSLEIIDLLFKKNVTVEYSDPFLKVFPKTRRYDYNLKSVDLNSKNLKYFDALILATDHDLFDYGLIKKADVVIDTRGRIKKRKYRI
tara:strand:+ start:789 stop:2102 length:1314 start_codon:yes stop_codon:yes gene_type:complete